MVAEAYERTEEAIERYRLALITHDPSIAPELYPEWRTTEMTEQEIDRAMGDPTQVVEYDLDVIPPEEAESILAEMLADRSGVVRG